MGLLVRQRFLTLPDTPSSYSGQTGLFTRVNAGEDALEFIAVTPGSTTYLGLTDTPSAYTGQRFRIPRVDSAEGAIEFVNERGWPQLDDLAATNWGLPGWSWEGTAQQTFIADDRLYVPIFVERRRTFTQIGVHVNQTGAGTVCRLGLYEADFDGDGELTPGALTLDAGTVGVTTTGQKSIAISEQLDPGFHFVQVSCDGNVGLLGPNLLVAATNPMTGGNTTITGASNVVLAVTVADGGAALPDPATAPTSKRASRWALVMIGE